jgi:hypothetical protein
VPGGLAGALLVSVPPMALLALAAWMARAEPAALGMSALELTGLVVAAGFTWQLAAGRAGRGRSAGGA